MVQNILTFDVEDWSETMLELLEVPVARPQYPTRMVVQQTLDVLDTLKKHGAEATFFILGTVAEKFPGLVSEISNQGHEIASHGYRHRLITKQSPDEFSHDIAQAISTLKTGTKQEIVGYRAPFFSITKRSQHALDILATHGLRYDSSIFPIRRPLYGIPSAQRFIHRLDTNSGRSIIEIPLSTLRLFKTNLPVAGGGYFRVMPYSFTRWAIKRINDQGHPAIVYIHPHDLYELPKPPRELLQRKRGSPNAVSETLFRLQNLGRRGGMEKLLRLLNDFEFTSAKRRVSSFLP